MSSFSESPFFLAERPPRFSLRLSPSRAVGVAHLPAVRRPSSGTPLLFLREQAPETPSFLRATFFSLCGSDQGRRAPGGGSCSDVRSSARPCEGRLSLPRGARLPCPTVCPGLARRELEVGPAGVRAAWEVPSGHFWFPDPVCPTLVVTSNPRKMSSSLVGGEREPDLERTPRQCWLACSIRVGSVQPLGLPAAFLVNHGGAGCYSLPTSSG